MNLQAFQKYLGQAVGLTAIAAAAVVSAPAWAESTQSTPSSPSATTEVQPVENKMEVTPVYSGPAAAPAAAPAAPAATPDATPSTTQPEVAPGTDSSATPDAAPETTTSTGTIVDVAASSGTFKTLLTAVQAAELTEALESTGPYTVFAPTDEAFAALPKGTLEMLLKPENKDKLKKVLAYHVVPGNVESTELKAGEVKTVEGSPITVSLKDNKVMVNNADVTTPDIKASNGVIHVIDKVILPPDM